MTSEEPEVTPDLRAQRGPHVFVEDLEVLELGDDDRSHLTRSLRLREGDALTASDAMGSWRSVSFGHTLAPTGPIHTPAPPAFEIGIGLALTKAAKPELAVQKATEIGLDEIVVFQAQHSVARWDESKRAKGVARLGRVAREAAMQSRRLTIPTVSFVDDLAALTADRNVVRADFGGIPTNSEHRFVAIGPEGGWSDAEVQATPVTVDLGPTVLRAETAAVVASAFLARSRGNNG